MTTQIMVFILSYYIVMNVALFGLMGRDKAMAKKRLWRIPEKTLLVMGAIGGFLGGYIGMYTYHHKTQKMYFHLTYIISLVVHGALWFYLLFVMKI